MPTLKTAREVIGSLEKRVPGHYTTASIYTKVSLFVHVTVNLYFNMGSDLSTELSYPPSESQQVGSHLYWSSVSLKFFNVKSVLFN